ncbi:MAG: methyltransferase domain-containing protein [Geobacter sp.]
MNDYRELLIGCGQNITKKNFVPGHENWNQLVTLDINPDHSPDVLWDLNQLPLPFEDNWFDEIHAYEVLEHCGKQGDYKFFFNQFSDFYRILKPGGTICGTCPHHLSVWAWGDPSHTRVIQKENFVFLSQNEYKIQIGTTAMSDFRYIYKSDFDVVFLSEDNDVLQFVLKAIKPSRI